MDTTNAILTHALDLHVHSGPDVRPRVWDDLDLSRACRTAGLFGALIKSHTEPTASRAYLAGHTVGGVQMFGGLVLNRAVGGLNPDAVDAFAKGGGGFGRIVWLPTRDAAHEMAFRNRRNATVAVTADNAPVSAFQDVAQAIADADLVLATGHVAPEEGLLLLCSARDLGCRRLLITHATAPISDYALDQLDRAAKLGAYIELCARNFYAKGPDGRLALSDDLVLRGKEVLMRYGHDRVVLSSDLGDAIYPTPTDGLREAAQALLVAGVPEERLHAALVTTPRTLIRADVDPATV